MSLMTPTRTLRIIAIAAGAGLWLAAAALLWRTQVPDDLRLPALRARAEFPAGVVAQTADYARFLRLDWLVSVAAQLVVLVLLARRGAAIAARLHGARVARGLQLLLLTLAAQWLVSLPFGAAGHWWRRRHGITHQGYLDWLMAPWLQLTAGALLACGGLALAMLLAHRLGTRWWLPAAPLLAALGAASVLVQPLVLAPRFQPLRDRPPAAEIDRLAGRLGVRDIEVRVQRVHDRTRVANATLDGVGPTRRLVLWDTLLDGRFSRAEVRFVAAHELAHAARRHLWKGIAWFALLSPLLTLAIAVGTRPRGGLGEPAAVPLAVLVAVALQLALLPFTNAVSRRYEAEADWVALQVTRDPDAGRGFFGKLVRTNLAQPDPPAWARVLLGTHPSLLERIEMTAAWKRRRSVSTLRLPQAGADGSSTLARWTATRRSSRG
jgi:STE24 endopeptidase